jgi:hypothetical protein
MRWVLRWTVSRGYQDDFRAEANFATKEEALAFVEAKGWIVGEDFPDRPSVWVRQEMYMAR